MSCVALLTVDIVFTQMDREVYRMPLIVLSVMK